MNSLRHFIASHLNEPALIVGGAPCWLDYPFDKHQGPIFSCGDTPIRAKSYFHTDYWVFANPCWVRPWLDQHARAIEYVSPRKAFVGLTAFAFQPARTVERKIKTAESRLSEYLVYYDHYYPVHLYSNPSSFASVQKARSLLSIDLTLQEHLRNYYRSCTTYSIGGTVAIQCLALAMLMGCNPITTVGIVIPPFAPQYSYAKTELDQNLYGSLGPYYNENNILSIFGSHIRSNLRSVVKSAFYSSFNVFRSLSSADLVKPSVFSPIRSEIRQDFQSLCFMHSSRGGSLYNWSRGLLDELEGINIIGKGI